MALGYLKSPQKRVLVTVYLFLHMFFSKIVVLQTHLLESACMMNTVEESSVKNFATCKRELSLNNKTQY